MTDFSRDVCYLMPEMITKSLILAAGPGTGARRLNSATPEPVVQRIVHADAAPGTRPFKVLVLDAPLGGTVAMQVVQCLATDGAFAISVASTDPRPIAKYSRWVKRFYRLPAGRDQTATLHRLKSILRSERFDILLPVGVDEIAFLANHMDDELRSLTRIPDQPSAKAFEIANSKSLLSAFMEEHGIEHPRTVRFDAQDPSMPERLAGLALPVITKPTWGGGGSGIRVFESREPLCAHLAEHSAPGNPLVAQEFVGDHDVGVAVYCRAGEILYMTMQRVTSSAPQTFRPSKAIHFFESAKLTELVARLMKALAWNGIAQVDLRVDSATGDAHVLEINPRYWGSVLGSQRMGVNFPAIACRMAVGLLLPEAGYRHGRYITAMGYVQQLWRFSRGQPAAERISFGESACSEIVRDPLPRVWEALRRVFPWAR
ncbi:MAG: ATP-grasp domain-containing protein [Polaromonas sp.]|nr:ATP-grasp domain-containing protein [Polaromonas sp.]